MNICFFQKYATEYFMNDVNKKNSRSIFIFLSIPKNSCIANYFLFSFDFINNQASLYEKIHKKSSCFR